MSSEALPLSESARTLLSQAQGACAKFRALDYIGTEHLLLALAAQQGTVASRVLRRAGIEAGKVQRDIRVILTRGEGPGVCPPGFTSRAKAVMDLAVGEAVASGTRRVTTGHMMLGMLAEGEGIAAYVLKSYGMELGQARTQVAREIEQESEP